MNLFQHFGHLVSVAGLLFSSYLGHNNAHVTAQPVKSAVTASNYSTDSDYIATKNVSYNGYSINMEVAVPKDGGSVSGKISGDCDGKITGNYDGQSAINGQANVMCHLLFMQIPGKATFTGTVNKEDKTAQLQVTFSADSFQKTAPVTFSFN